MRERKREKRKKGDRENVCDREEVTVRVREEQNNWREREIKERRVSKRERELERRECINVTMLTLYFKHD